MRNGKRKTDTITPFRNFPSYLLLILRPLLLRSRFWFYTRRFGTGIWQLALRIFQVIASNQGHILIEIVDAAGDAIDSEIGAESAARYGTESRIFHPLPERVALAYVRQWAFID